MTDMLPLIGKRLLVLEDDFYLAKDAATLLTQAGAEVVGPFGNAADENTLCAAGELDGAVVDINLGHGPSFAFAQALGDAKVPFVFVTGYDAATIPDAFAHVERLEKPLRRGELVAAVARAIG